MRLSFDYLLHWLSIDIHMVLSEEDFRRNFLLDVQLMNLLLEEMYIDCPSMVDFSIELFVSNLSHSDEWYWPLNLKEYWLTCSLYLKLKDVTITWIEFHFKNDNNKNNNKNKRKSWQADVKESDKMKCRVVISNTFLLLSFANFAFSFRWHKISLSLSVNLRSYAFFLYIYIYLTLSSVNSLQRKKEREWQRFPLQSNEKLRK